MLAEQTGNEPSVRSAGILNGTTDVIDPVSSDERWQMHDGFDWYFACRGRILLDSRDRLLEFIII